MASVDFPYKTIKDVDVQNKRILMRADYNVPLRADGFAFRSPQGAG